MKLSIVVMEYYNKTEKQFVISLTLQCLVSLTNCNCFASVFPFPLRASECDRHHSTLYPNDVNGIHYYCHGQVSFSYKPASIIIISPLLIIPSIHSSRIWYLKQKKAVTIVC